MKINRLLCAVVAACVVTNLALAQGRGDRDRERGARGPDRHEMERRGDERREGGPPFHFRQGDRLPPEYRHRNYVIDDWRAYHLRRPPRGYQWERIGSEFVLVAIPTGVIVQIVINP